MNSINNNNPLNTIVDSLFNSSLSDIIGSDFLSDKPSVNIIEEENSFIIELAAPGYEKKDFSIEAVKDQLVISSEQKPVELQASEKFTKREFNYKSFKRSFHLPETVDKESIKASYKHGILSIDLAKKEIVEDPAKKITIK